MSQPDERGLTPHLGLFSVGSSSRAKVGDFVSKGDSRLQGGGPRGVAQPLLADPTVGQGWPVWEVLEEGALLPCHARPRKAPAPRTCAGLQETEGQA